MSRLATFMMIEHLGAALLVAAIAIGLMIRVAILVSQKNHSFPHR